MMPFDHQLSMTQFLIPPICTGILAGGLILYAYMYVRYRLPLYLAVAINAIFAIVFVGSETLILSLGAWAHDFPLAVHFHRSEQLAGAFFLFGLPHLLVYLLDLNAGMRRLNRIISFVGLGAAIVIMLSSFIVPDLFISITVHKASSLQYEADFGRGQEGVLYQLRDMFLSIVILYSFVCILYDLVKHKNTRNLLLPALGISLAIGGAIIDSLFVHTDRFYDFFPDRYFSRFSVGITAMVVSFMSSVTRRFIDAAKQVERVNAIISVSEKKYRFLVEETNDCILLLDKDLTIIDANRSAFGQLPVSRDRFRSMTLFDLVYADPNDAGVTEQVIRDRLDELRQNKKSIAIKTMLQTSRMNEPREYFIRFEYIQKEDIDEILVKASNMPEDILLKFIGSEKITYTIGNNLRDAEEISKRLVLNLKKFMTAKDINFLRIGLREMIINSIEHGNLNITFAEKTDASLGDDYLGFIRERQDDPRYKDKKVNIEYLLTPGKVMYKITDEGDGFDYHAVMEQIRSGESEANRDMLAHGRGIAIARNTFDKIIFNKKGNQVLLVKNFS